MQTVRHDIAVPEAPPAKQLRAMFRSAAEALLANRPLRGASSPAVQAPSALTRPELEALHSVGLSTEPWPPQRPDDPLSRSIVDYIALVETSLTTAEAARRLKCDVSRIRQRLRERSLFGFEHEGEWRLPRFQFERGHPLPGLATVLAALPPELNALDVAGWFLRAHPDLESENQPAAMSPRAWLLRGLPPERPATLARDI
jgi:hypothetical protein